MQVSLLALAIEDFHQDNPTIYEAFPVGIRQRPSSAGAFHLAPHIVSKEVIVVDTDDLSPSLLLLLLFFGTPILRPPLFSSSHISSA